MDSPSKTPDPLRRMTDGYAAAGLPLTTQRRALIEVLAGRVDHPTVDQIYSSLTERLPEVSRATVYRSLEVLTDLGLLKRVEHPGSSARYDPNMEPHNHFLCTQCGALTDLPDGALEGVDGITSRIEPPARADEMTVFVRGTCGCCTEQN